MNLRDQRRRAAYKTPEPEVAEPENDNPTQLPEEFFNGGGTTASAGNSPEGGQANESGGTT